MNDFNERLHSAICSYYDEDQLEQMVLFRLNEQLKRIIKESSLSAMVLDLIQWTLLSGPAMRDLPIHVAMFKRKDGGRVAELDALCTEFESEKAQGFPHAPSPSTSIKSGMTPSDLLRVAVQGFHALFEQRIELFDFLRAYKKLHDVLHELQGLQPRIDKAVADRKSDPSLPFEEDVADELDELVKRAYKSAADTEFPDEPPGWIAKMDAAVKDIVGADATKFSSMLGRLRNLPSKELRQLNDKLIENARRLKAAELIESLNGVLAAIGAAAAPAVAKLRGEVESFRGMCSELVELIHAHNLCQHIDNAFREAPGLTLVTPDGLADWDDARKSLEELAVRKPNDIRVKRTNEAARHFAAANQDKAFTTLVERFDDLFMKTDKALLDVTNELPTAAIKLKKVLEDFR